MSSINPGAGGGAKPRRSLPNADGDVDADATTAAAEPGPNQELQDQTARMRMQVETLRKKCAELQKINLELQEESQKIRVESGELMSYIQKKTQRRQSMVVTLNDKNMKELADIAESKTQMIEEFYMKEAAIRASIMAKESTLSDVRKEMDELNYLRVLRDHQAKEIKDLEAEVEAVKLGNKEQQHDMKHAYLQKRKVFEDEAEEKITKMKQEAKQDAQRRVQEHIVRVKRENEALRAKINDLSDDCKGFEKSRVKFLQDIGELEAEKRSQERINQFRYGTPKSSAKPQNAASSVQERLSFTQFVPDRRTFPSDGIPRAPILSALPSSTRHSRRSSGAARKRNY